MLYLHSSVVGLDNAHMAIHLLVALGTDSSELESLLEVSFDLSASAASVSGQVFREDVKN